MQLKSASLYECGGDFCLSMAYLEQDVSCSLAVISKIFQIEAMDCGARFS